jgi:galactokinase
MPLFSELFGREPTVQAEAPGRVNLMGEHTDYNGGFVLPTPIAQTTRVALAVGNDRNVRAVSTASGSASPQSYTVGEESRGRGWLDYVQGVTAVLRSEGSPPGGFYVRIETDVPLGGGLSSSASLSVALFRALREAFGLALDDRRIAILGQRVENQFVGAQVGVMDPMACSLGQPGAALFLDTRSLEYELVSLPDSCEWVVIHSGVAHEHATGDYNTRRAECERAAALLGVKQLRDLAGDDLPRISARLEALPEPLIRRARHVVKEDMRVHRAVEAMRAGDVVTLGALFNYSHASQRDDYEVSVPAVDRLAALAQADPEVYGCRLTGGGFGGSVVLLAKAGCGRKAAERVARQYAKETGHRPTVL